MRTLWAVMLISAASGRTGCRDVGYSWKSKGFPQTGSDPRSRHRREPPFEISTRHRAVILARRLRNTAGASLTRPATAWVLGQMRARDARENGRTKRTR